ncbi:unnamed protein product [Pleuronectes platessa]|uniref:Uncharacterized protein n=1 Tax=Pleuronectes platessa TaxID=8262 RepID=A0A9N7U3B3_PLEPL|nr:unnamed protein product [Pleuronectes platessa]
MEDTETFSDSLLAQEEDDEERRYAHTIIGRSPFTYEFKKLLEESKTCEVTGANIRRGLPKISLFFHPAEGGRLLSFSNPSKASRLSSLSSPTSPRGGAWLIQLPSLSNPQPEVRGAAPSSPFKEISSPFKFYKTPHSDAMSCRKTSTSI